MFGLSALLSFCFMPAVATAVIYDCSTEFGEAVPLQLAFWRSGKSIPELSKSWNSAVRDDPNLTSKIKSEERLVGSDRLVFEWRYAKRPGPSFTIETQCPTTGKCSGKFKNQSGDALIFDTKLFDRRFPSARGYVQMQLGDREELALRVRIFKEMGDPAPAAARTLSASGEHMILGPESRFIMDVGVDEHLDLSRGFEHRLATLEIKVRCSQKL